MSKALGSLRPAYFSYAAATRSGRWRATARASSTACRKRRAVLRAQIAPAGGNVGAAHENPDIGELDELAYLCALARRELEQIVGCRRDRVDLPARERLKTLARPA